MSNQISDRHIVRNDPLPSPQALGEAVPRSSSQAETVLQTRHEIQSILDGSSDRFLVIVGPCSIHDLESGREYAERLATLSKKVAPKLLTVMRVYFEKPRTTVGWKGLIMDPKLDGSNDIAGGLKLARQFLSEVLNVGLPTATELLDPITPQYIADLVCWSAIGARTSESQTHRQMASGLSMPLGFKNATHGSIVPAVNAIRAAVQEQTFLGVNEEGIASAVTTSGNPHCHLILRGGDNGPNYEAPHIEAAAASLEKANLSPHLLVDASHANCEKNHELQPNVFRAIVKQRKEGNRHIIGGMLESNLQGGNQKFPQPLNQLKRGVSITDPCIDWETTESLLIETADRLS